MMPYLLLFIASVLLTYIVRRFAMYCSIMDVPNERSSHTVAVPRGGGVAIITVFYTGLFYFRHIIDQNLFDALWCALPVAAVSLADDIWGVPARIRLVIQTAAAVGALYLLGGIHAVGGWAFAFFALVWIVWMTNLYNFLDGIDGYAASQAVSVGLGMAWLFGMPLGGVIAAASLGFLLFNWQKASIFMGDVGSATLGFMFGALMISDRHEGHMYLWLVMLSLFWFDATVTLLRRWRNGEHLFTAHRKHAYQRLVQSGWSHQKVTILALIFNLCFLILMVNWNAPQIIFFLNLAALLGMMYMIDRKKGFE